MFLDEGDEIPVETCVQPRVEAEMAFVMATDLAGPGVTVADALTAVAGVMPAIEVVDSRIADWQVQVADTIADNASAGRVVLGGRITPVDRVDLRLIGVLLSPQRVGDRERAPARRRSATLPAASRGWRTSSARSVAGCAAATSCSPGRCTAWCRCGRATYFQAEFAHLGTVTVRFADGARHERRVGIRPDVRSAQRHDAR